MDTPEMETTIAEPEVTATSDTTTEGEDADTKRIEDKKAYLADLDRQIKDKEAKRNNVKSSEDQDDVIMWMQLNTDNLKLVPKEFQEELAFYKAHKIPVTNDIRDRALRDARARKGVRSTEERQASEVTTETRKVAATDDIPAAIKKANPNMTKEQYLSYKAEFDAKKK